MAHDPLTGSAACRCDLEPGVTHSPICPGNDAHLGPCICTDLGPCRGDPEDGPFDCEPCKQLLDITDACLNEPGAWPWTR